MTRTADIYLDHNATTPLWPSVANAISEALSDWGNPSSSYGTGTGNIDCQVLYTLGENIDESTSLGENIDEST